MIDQQKHVGEVSTIKGAVSDDLSKHAAYNGLFIEYDRPAGDNYCSVVVGLRPHLTFKGSKQLFIFHYLLLRPIQPAPVR